MATTKSSKSTVTTKSRKGARFDNELILKHATTITKTPGKAKEIGGVERLAEITGYPLDGPFRRRIANFAKTNTIVAKVYAMQAPKTKAFKAAANAA